MFRTGQALVEANLKDDWNRMRFSIIERLTESFHQNPYCFFTESDIHSVLYNITKEELQQNEAIYEKTIDGHRVSLVHHEYPTPFRCDMKGYGFEIKNEKPYKRGHYDLVVLNPEFVKNNALQVVFAKNYQRFSSAMQEVRVEPLIWTCEVIFFPWVERLPTNACKIIEQDGLKVRETLKWKVGRNQSFCMTGSVLVFTSHAAEEVLDLKQSVTDFGDKQNLEAIFIMR